MAENNKREVSRRGFERDPMEGIDVNMTFGEDGIRVGQIERPVDCDDLEHRDKDPL